MLYCHSLKIFLNLKQIDIVEQILNIVDNFNVIKPFLHVDDMTNNEKKQIKKSNSNQNTFNKLMLQFTDMNLIYTNFESFVKQRVLIISINETVFVFQILK